jgi:hypothetical protein
MERSALHELHRDEVASASFAHFVNGDDVGVVQRGRGLRLLKKPAAFVCVGGAVGRQELQRDRAVEQDVPGPVDHAHATFPETIEDFVVANGRSRHATDDTPPPSPACDDPVSQTRSGQRATASERSDAGHRSGASRRSGERAPV